MKKLTIFVVLLVLLVGALGVAFYFLSLPPKETMSKTAKEAAVAKLLGRKAQLEQVVQKTGNEKYDGKYISFDYPAAATIYEFSTPTSGTGSARLERFAFDLKAPKIYSIIQVSANRANFASVKDDPSVQLRHTQANLYKETDITIAGAKGKQFIKKEGGVEESIFWLYKDKVYTFVFMGLDIDAINKLSDQIVKTIQLK